MNAKIKSTKQPSKKKISGKRKTSARKKKAVVSKKPATKLLVQAEVRGEVTLKKVVERLHAPIPKEIARRFMIAAKGK